jgi:hypothetical protein
MKTITSIFFSFILFALITSFAITKEWIPLMQKDGVTISTKEIECQSPNDNKKHIYEVFKFENSNAYDLIVTYKLNLWIGENCRSCDIPSPNEYEVTIKLKAGETRTYDCNEESNTLKILKYTPGAKDQKQIRFEIVQLKIVKQ